VLIFWNQPITGLANPGLRHGPLACAAPGNTAAFQNRIYYGNKNRQNDYDDGWSNVLSAYYNFYISLGILPSSHSSSLFSLDLPTVMAQPQSISSDTCCKCNIVPDETSNTSTHGTQLHWWAENPHREGAEKATNTLYTDEKLNIVRISTAKSNKQKHTVGCMSFNYIQ
jgi:hypothetical protein